MGKEHESLGAFSAPLKPSSYFLTPLLCYDLKAGHVVNTKAVYPKNPRALW